VLAVAEVSIEGRTGTRRNRYHEKTTRCHILCGVAEELLRFIDVLQHFRADGIRRLALDRWVNGRDCEEISQKELHWELGSFGRGSRSANPFGTVFDASDSGVDECGLE
jgi:hypothetical protein